MGGGGKGAKIGVIRDPGGRATGATEEEALSDFRNQEPREDKDSGGIALTSIGLFRLKKSWNVHDFSGYVFLGKK